MENLVEVAASHRHLAEEIMGSAATEPVSIRGLVVPLWRTNLYPAAAVLRKYENHGCPVTVGQDWMLQ